MGQDFLDMQYVHFFYKGTNAFFFMLEMRFQDFLPSLSICQLPSFQEVNPDRAGRAWAVVIGQTNGVTDNGTMDQECLQIIFVLLSKILVPDPSTEPDFY